MDTVIRELIFGNFIDQNFIFINDFISKKMEVIVGGLNLLFGVGSLGSFI